MESGLEVGPEPAPRPGRYRPPAQQRAGEHDERPAGAYHAITSAARHVEVGSVDGQQRVHDGRDRPQRLGRHPFRGQIKAVGVERMDHEPWHYRAQLDRSTRQPGRGREVTSRQNRQRTRSREVGGHHDGTLAAPTDSTPHRGWYHLPTARRTAAGTTYRYHLWSWP